MNQIMLKGVDSEIVLNLYSQTWEFILANFMQVIKTPAFLNLPKNVMAEIFASVQNPAGNNNG